MPEFDFLEPVLHNPFLGSVVDLHRDYDLDAAMAAGVKPDERGHLPDTYKLPNHITFSSESKYADPGAGVWEKDDAGKWSFTPGSTNLKYHSKQDITDYFRQHEPDAILKWPQKIAAQSGFDFLEPVEYDPFAGAGQRPYIVITPNDRATARTDTTASALAEAIPAPGSSFMDIAQRVARESRAAPDPFSALVGAGYELVPVEEGKEPVEVK